jgi:AraC-like DNA-binding protein
MSPAHFSRQFKAAYGETPYGYLMTRRIERAMTLLRGGMSVTEACMTVGATSLGSFSSRFRELVGESPSSYRSREHDALEAMPACIAKVLGRPQPLANRMPQPGQPQPAPQRPSRIREAHAAPAH